MLELCLETMQSASASASDSIVSAKSLRCASENEGKFDRSDPVYAPRLPPCSCNVAKACGVDNEKGSPSTDKYI